MGIQTPGAPRWQVNFFIADVESAAVEAVAAGGSVHSEPVDVPGLPLREATLADPEGVGFTVSQLLA